MGLTRVDDMQVLPRSFFDRDPVAVARDLLGKLVIHDEPGQVLVGRIVETEAYLANHDSAAHSYRGQTPRNAVMFGPPGYAYVYAMHRYHCLNVVTEGEGQPSAILIRAVEPLEGHEVMAPRRGTDRLANLTSGPGKLCQSFGIDRAFNAWDVTQGDRLWLAEPRTDIEIEIGVTPRIGVTSAQEALLRFCDIASSCLSRPYRRL